MKTLVKTLSMIAICMVASFSLVSCSSSDDEPTKEQISIIGKWTTEYAEPLNQSDWNDKYTYTFVIPEIEFKSNGTFVWYSWNSEEARPNTTPISGTYTINEDKLIMSTTGSEWLSGSHTIQSVDKSSFTLITKSPIAMKIIFGPSVMDDFFNY